MRDLPERSRTVLENDREHLRPDQRAPALLEFEIGFFVDSDHEGRGYVTEAVRAVIQFIFQHLEAHRVRVECDDINIRNRRVAQRCGMVLEGHIRENKRNADGTLSGTLHFGLLRSQFAVTDCRAG
jgi:RimJ/RimL family protein N-acetyltransferase